MAKTIKHNGTWFYTDEDYDYSKEIQKAVDEGNFQKAAYLEKSRNAKIDYYGMPYDMTYDYQDYLPGAQNNKGGGESAVPSFEKGSNADKADRTLKRANAMNFHYNPQQDPLYKQIKNNYQKSVGDVIENTMGSYAGMTGGMPSSYAVSAAATAGNQHMQKADDMIPELYQLAYGKYADDKADLYKQYGIYQGLEEQQYNRKALEDQAAYEKEQAELKAKADAEAAQLDYEKWLSEFTLDATKAENTALNNDREYWLGVMNGMIENGTPPPDYVIANAGLEGVSGQQLLDDYRAEGARVLREKSKYSGGSGGGTKKADDLKRPTSSMFEAIDKLFGEDGAGIDGYSKLKGRYDWGVYDEAAFDAYVQDYYGDVEGVEEYMDVHSLFDNESKPMTTDDYASEIADEINGLYMSDSEESGYAPIIKNKDGTFSVSGSAANRVIDMIEKNENITQEMAAELIFMFGITQKQLENYINNDNY